MASRVIRVRRDPFLKERDSWIDVIVLEHVAVPLTYALARLRYVTPTAVSVVSILVRTSSAGFFAVHWLRVGGAVYLVGLLLDGVDGKLARCTGRTSERGALLDYSADFGIFVVLTALLGRAAGASASLTAACAALGVASAFATEALPHRPSESAAPTEGRWQAFTASHRLIPLPGVVEAHALLFGVTPLVGQALVTPVLAACAAYFGVTWLAKVRVAAGKGAA